MRNISFNVAECFVENTVDEIWVLTICQRIIPWIKSKKNKSYWELVLFVSQKRGIIKPKLARWNFSKLIIEKCREYLDNTDKESSIASNMDKFRFKRELKIFDDLCYGHVLRSEVKELEDLFDGSGYAPLVLEEQTKPLVAQLTEQYLRNYIVSNSYQKVVSKPLYSTNIQPTIALEQYFSSSTNDSPSFIVAFECIEGQPNWDSVYKQLWDYIGNKKIKLIIVASVPFPHDFLCKAEKHNIGLWRYDLNKMDKHPKIILNRITNYEEGKQYELKRLLGQEPMETTMLLFNCGLITSSLCEILNNLCFTTKKELQIVAPYLTDSFIEQQAYTLLTNSDLYPIDPFTIAKKLEIQYDYQTLLNNQAGIINFQEKRIIINKNDSNNIGRINFTMAHEIGHYVFHYDLIKKYGLIAMDETNETLIDESISNKELYWLEHHANHFASCLLMPRNIIYTRFIKHYYNNITNVYGCTRYHLYWADNNNDAKYNSLAVIIPIARELNVSKEAVKWRLYRLGLLTIEGYPDKPFLIDLP